MYSQKVQKALEDRKIKIGDKVQIKKLGKITEGLLMPQTGAGDSETLIIKLDNGYNFGIKFKDAGLKKISSGSKHLGSKTKNKIKFDKNKPPISIISTGGTVASKIDYLTGGVTGLMDPDEILSNVPELSKIVNISRMEIPFTKMSEDMGYLEWQDIAKTVAKRLNAGDKGVIVTHGTDFLAYTAAALSFFLKDLNKPVVLVGAQRSSDRGSSDSGMNLICGAVAATSEIAEVGICMHAKIDDDYCLFSRGTKVRKMDTQRRDAFRPINEYPLAHIWPDGRLKVKNMDHKARDDNGKVGLDLQYEPKVGFLKVVPDSDPLIIDLMVDNGYKGFVLEAPGLGHVPTIGSNSWIATIKKHTDNGIPFISVPQTIYGRINPNVYSNLRTLYKDAGAIPGQDMLPETAYVKLGWVLGHRGVAGDVEKVKEMMLTNYAGEITKRTLPGTFLY